MKKETNKIIIPKEELKQKQELERGITITHVEKQETLEKAAEKRYPFEDGFQVMDIDISEMLQLAFINGAKWQQERSYSEEEVLELLHKRMTYTLGEEYKKETTLEWLEHLKNKHEKQIKFLPVTDKIM
jgi:hypothetical protein